MGWLDCEVSFACSHTGTTSLGMTYQSGSLGTIASSLAVNCRCEVRTFQRSRDDSQLVVKPFETPTFKILNSPYVAPVGA